MEENRPQEPGNASGWAVNRPLRPENSLGQSGAVDKRRLRFDRHFEFADLGQALLVLLDIFFEVCEFRVRQADAGALARFLVSAMDFSFVWIL
ncbi:MAG: hypothetical protein DMG23_15020 [Acidobacteria bacterium]|nr:MAG: hypothetical protein DMG23_15020 [Acidobacteriota bacterium]